MEVSSWENHLFLWAIYTMAMLDNQSDAATQRPVHQHAAWSESLMHHVGGVEVAQPPETKASQSWSFPKSWGGSPSYPLVNLQKSMV